MTVPHLFVYGTLRHRPLIARLVGHAVEAQPASLAGHRAAPIPGRAYPGLVVDPASSATGAIVEVSAADIAVLDSFEGADYERVDVVVDVPGEAVPAQTYLLGDARLAGDGVWSFERFLAEDAAGWVRSAIPGDRHPDHR